MNGSYTDSGSASKSLQICDFVCPSAAGFAIAVACEPEQFALVDHDISA